MAMSLSKPHPTGRTSDAGEARRRPVRRPRRWESAGGWRSSASASSPACPTCSRATPPTTCSTPIDEIGVRDGANLVVDGYDFAPVVLDLDHDRGVPEPAGDLGARAGWYTTEPFSEPEVFDFPRASARSSA
jgi:hypothetical protein